MHILKLLLLAGLLFVVLLLVVISLKPRRIRRLTDPRRDRVHHRRR
ncbi:MAG: hypothetical protein IIW59_00510 [Alistipes sp.]|nr:hypothetical protein [Alistipes sp.]